MSRRPALASSDPLQVLRSLALRGSPSPSLVGPAEPGRVGPTVAGLVSLMQRRGHEHARIRAWNDAGLLVCGQDDAEVVDGDTARACLQALREAASLPASSPAGFGSLAALGLAAHVEIAECHDGSRAFVHLSSSGMTLSDPLLDAVTEADADALRDLHGRVVPPEELIALRRGGRWADMPNILVRHCDIALLSVERRLPSSAYLVNLLHQTLTQALRVGRWRLALEPMAECVRYCARVEAERASGAEADRDACVRAVLDECWATASPSTRECLRAAGRVVGPLLSLDPA